MRALWTVFSKECVDHVRDRRSLFSALLFGPLLGPVLFGIMMGAAITMAADDVEKALEVPVVGAERAPELIAFLRENRIDVVEFEGEDPRAAVEAGEEDYVLRVDEGYRESFRAGRPASIGLYADRSRQRLAGDLRRIESTVNGYQRKIGQLRLMSRGVDGRLMQPIVLEEVDVSTPEARGLLMAGMLPYFILLSVMMGGFSLAIDTTAGERERGSLEPLLTTAASRAAILGGKLLATALFCLAALAIVLTAFSISFRFVPLELADMAIALDARAAVTAFWVVAPFTVLGAAIMCLVASFTRSFKEAQTWLSVVLFVPILPAVIHFIRPFEPTLLNLAVPVLGQHVALLEILAAETLSPAAVIVNAGSTLVLAGLVACAAWLFYRREGLLG